jgi:hypothetical protein
VSKIRTLDWIVMVALVLVLVGKACAWDHSSRARRVVPNDYWYNWQVGDASADCGTDEQSHRFMFFARDDLMNLERAWAITTGDSTVVAAIIDSGVEIHHPDLWPRRWRNVQEIEGLPGVDDDGNHVVDDLWGWDAKHWDSSFYYGKYDWEGSGVNYYDGVVELNGTNLHGTRIVGVFGAATNNESWSSTLLPDRAAGRKPGIASIAWKPRVMPVMALALLFDGDESIPYPSMAGITSGFEYISKTMQTTGANVRVVNCSFVAPIIPEVQYYIDLMNEAGVLVVTGAGNGTRNSTAWGNSGAYNNGMAKYDGVLTVSAVDAVHRRTNTNSGSGCRYGANYFPEVDVCGYSSDSSHMLVGGSNWEDFLPYEDGLSDYQFMTTNLLVAEDGFDFPRGWEFCQSDTLNATSEPARNFTVVSESGCTSAATAMGTGVALLLFSLYPDLTPPQAIGAIRRGSVSVTQWNLDNCCDLDVVCAENDGDRSCEPYLGAGQLDAYRTLTLWGTVPRDTTLSGDVYVSADVFIPAGVTVKIKEGTTFYVAPDDLWGDVTSGFWEPEAQYDIDSGDLTTVMDDLVPQIYISGEMIVMGAVVMKSFVNDEPTLSDWGGVYVQPGGTLVNASALYVLNAFDGITHE